ncbi:MAG: hypothetical protein JSV25_08985 [Spirochaetota bacterium]|nr:MAG: hypothetical protein JSV25_08985 [Spirochaetota bacterium]
MRKLAFSLIIFLFVIGTMSRLIGQEIEIRGDTDHEELTVHEGVEFKVRIEGSGWYLNRYDREHLSFIRRFVEPSYTSFDIYSKKSGQSYLLFSYLDKDVYVMVNIDQTPLVEEQVQTEVLSPEDSSTAVYEEKIKLEAEPSTDIPKEGELPKKLEKESEIYYVDKEKKKVPVPFKDEDDQYRKGVRYFNRGAYSDAENEFTAYLESCESCKYRVEAVMNLAETYLALDNKRKAGFYYDKVINFKNEKYMKEALVKRGDIFYSDSNLEAAVSHYERALEYSKKDLVLLKIVADIHYELNNYKMALGEYEKLKDSGEADDEVFFRIATIYDSPGGPRDIQKAYNYYKILIDKFSFSEHVKFARKRVDFMEKNFFNYK